MSFRQYGGINYAARNNIVKTNFTNANNLSIMTKVGQPDSKINVQSTLDVYAINLTSTTITSNQNGLVPKSYVDLVTLGLTPLVACQCATTGPLSPAGDPSSTNYSTSLVIDGYPVQNNDRVLIKDQPSTNVPYDGSVENGIYVFTNLGSFGTFTRSSDYSNGIDAYGAYTAVQEGVINGNRQFIEVNRGNVGIDPLLFTNFSSTFSTGNGLEKISTGSSTIIQVRSDLSTSSDTNNFPFITKLAVTGATTLGSLSVTGNSVLSSATVSGALNATGTNTINGYAPLASPALTGTPTAPTATAGNNSTQIATTAYVDRASGGGFWALNGANIYNTNLGNVGIGTNTPQKKLQVSNSDALINLLTVGRGNGDGTFNTAFGTNTLIANTFNSVSPGTAGNYNSGFGTSTLQNNTTGIHNTAVGSTALLQVTAGSYNTSIGSGSCGGAGNISYNTSVGFEALYICNANNNTALGYQAGKNIISLTSYSSTNNTLIGYNAGGTIGVYLVNCTLLGANSTPSISTATNEITLGDSSITKLRCQVTSITAISDLRDKKNIRNLDAGLDFINELKPVRFDWNMRDGGKVDIPDTGFIAQHLQEAQINKSIIIPNLVSDNNPDKLEACYGTLIPVLVKAVQEMSSTINRLEAKINELTLRNS